MSALREVTLSPIATNAVLMRLPSVGNPHHLYQQVMDADVRRRKGETHGVVLYLDSEERRALLKVLPEALHGEVRES